MSLASPLRYPGGKSAMSGLLSELRSMNNLSSLSVAEPFAGGAGASLKLLHSEQTEQIMINDADRAIYALWWSLLNRTEQFIGLLSDTEVSVREWWRQQAIYRKRGRVSRIQKGFAAFFLNRCNHSGIMNAGPIGGLEQKGKWKITARFNKDALLKTCDTIGQYRERISVSCADGLEFIKTLNPDKTMFFIDPPYFNKGAKLYLNCLDEDYHRKLAAQLRKMKRRAWILTYDDCPEIREMYGNWARINPYSLSYSAYKIRKGSEILITPKWLKIPNIKNLKTQAIDPNQI